MSERSARVFVPVHDAYGSGGGGSRGGGSGGGAKYSANTADTPLRIQIPIPEDQVGAVQNVYGVRYGAEAYPPPPPYQPPAPIQEGSNGNVEGNGVNGVPPDLYRHPPPYHQHPIQGNANGNVEGNGINVVPSGLYRHPPPYHQYPPLIQGEANGNVEGNGVNGVPQGLYRHPPPYQQHLSLIQEGSNGNVEGNGVNDVPPGLYRYPPPYPQPLPPIQEGLNGNVAGNGMNGLLYGYPPHVQVGILAGNGIGFSANQNKNFRLPVDHRKPFGANGLTFGTHLYPIHRPPAPIHEDVGPETPPSGANGVGLGLQRYRPGQLGFVGQYGGKQIQQPLVSTAQAVVPQSTASSGQSGVTTFSVASPGQLKVSAQSELSSLQQGLRLADLNKLRLSGSAGLGQLGSLGVEELSQVLGSQGIAGPHMNPVFATLLMGSLIPSPALGVGHNHFRTQHHHLQGLLLKHYGKYLPYGLGSYGLYGYSASNNVHNSNAFGRYKYENRI